MQVEWISEIFNDDDLKLKVFKERNPYALKTQNVHVSLFQIYNQTGRFLQALSHDLIVKF